MLDNGVRVMVPPHIAAGTRIVVDVYEQTYVRRGGLAWFRHSGLITVMQRAARKAAPRLRRDFGEVEQLQVSRKGPADFVSMADKRAEQTIVEELRNARPDWGLLLEEGGEIEGNPDKPRWIVDPLDGTTNFLHGIPHFAISIAVEERQPGRPSRDHPRPGLPAADRRELLGREGPGRLAPGPPAARLGAPRPRRGADRAPACPHIGHGDVATLDARSSPRSRREVAGIRRFGSAALDLAWVAAGRFDGFWEDDLDIWDIAAGMLLVREAGGFVTDFRGQDRMIEQAPVSRRQRRAPFAAPQAGRRGAALAEARVFERIAVLRACPAGAGVLESRQSR